MRRETLKRYSTYMIVFSTNPFSMFHLTVLTKSYLSEFEMLIYF